MMSETSINAIECDHDGCEERRLITDGTKEGSPRMSWLTQGWVEIQHRLPDDHLGITLSHYCPEHAPVYVDEQIYNGNNDR